MYKIYFPIHYKLFFILVKFNQILNFKKKKKKNQLFKYFLYLTLYSLIMHLIKIFIIFFKSFFFFLEREFRKINKRKVLQNALMLSRVLQKFK